MTAALKLSDSLLKQLNKKLLTRHLVLKCPVFRGCSELQGIWGHSNNSNRICWNFANLQYEWCRSIETNTPRCGRRKN